MNRSCPKCGSPLAAGLREDYCPVCSLRGAMDRGAAPATVTENLRVIGDYEILGEIAQGGMGVVFRARQRGLGRVVAVKMILAGQFASEAARQRFRAEASAAAKLQHPNIVAIHDIAEHEGQPYFSMDLVEGRTLADVVRDEPMPPRETAACVQAMAKAIHYAHQRGVVHRDLKPSNVLIDASGAPRITDFGIAMQMGGEETRLTLSGQVLGSPAYVSPEQARGVAGEVGPAADIYSLGAILYQLLAGRPPFQGDSIQAILRQVESDEPIAPRRLNPSAPVDLETICLKCLEKEPSRRYASAGELAEDLGRYLKGELVRARPIGPAGRLMRWSARHPMIAGLAGSVLALLVLVAAGSSIAAFRIKQGERAATANLRTALLSQARALRLAGQVGRRAEGLAAIEQANRLEPTPEQRVQLRNEAIAILALSDLRFVPLPSFVRQANPSLIRFDRRFESFLIVEDDAALVRRRFADGLETARLPLKGLRVDRILDFGGEGRYAIVRNGQGQQLLDLATGLRLRESAGVLLLSSDAKRLVELGMDGSVALFELPELREARRFTAVFNGNSGLPRAALSADGNSLALAGAGERVVQILDCADGTIRERLNLDTRVTALAWHTEMPWLGTGTADGRISVWEPRSGRRLFTMRNPAVSGAVAALAFESSRTMLAAAYEGGAVDLWDATGELKPLTLTAEAGALQFSPDSRRISGAAQQGRPGFIESLRSDVLRTAKPALPQAGVYRAMFSPDGRLAASAGRGRIYLSEAATGGEKAMFDFELMRAVHFGPGGDSLLFCGMQGVFNRPLIKSGPGEWQLGARQTWLTGTNWMALAVSGDGRRAVAVQEPSSGIWIQRRPDEPFEKLAVHPGALAVAMSADGRTIASGGPQSSQVRVWDAESGRELRTIETPGGSRLTLSADGRWLVTFGDGCKLWSLSDKNAAAELIAPKRGIAVSAVAVHPDASLLALVQGTGANEVQLFEPATGRLLAILQGPASERLQDVAFSADGWRLMATTPDGMMKLWDLRRLMEELRSRNLSW